jgi:hypothetical protein
VISLYFETVGCLYRREHERREERRRGEREGWRLSLMTYDGKRFRI